MPVIEKMTSRELGLVLAQQLLAVEELHYGLWDPDLELSLVNLPVAQQRYSEMLLMLVGRLLAGASAPHILDVGCGTGQMLQQLTMRGFQVDAVNPSAHLNRKVRERLAAMGNTTSVLLETGFESIPEEHCQGQYDLLLFSESFQYIPLADICARAPALLNASGQIVICDFFKTAAHRAGGEGDRSFSGGHVLSEFYRLLETSEFEMEQDEDITARISPNIALLDEWLTQRLVPAVGSIDQYLQSSHPRLTKIFKWLARRKLERVRYKYLSGNRSQAMFEKYKSYRLIVLRRRPAVTS